MGNKAEISSEKDLIHENSLIQNKLEEKKEINSEEDKFLSNQIIKNSENIRYINKLYLYQL